jgi:hypothetical protein
MLKYHLQEIPVASNYTFENNFIDGEIKEVFSGLKYTLSKYDRSKFRL